MIFWQMDVKVLIQFAAVLILHLIGRLSNSDQVKLTLWILLDYPKASSTVPREVLAPVLPYLVLKTGKWSYSRKIWEAVRTRIIFRSFVIYNLHVYSWYTAIRLNRIYYYADDMQIYKFWDPNNIKLHV